MGAATSSQVEPTAPTSEAALRELRARGREVARFVMPVYFTDAPLSPAEHGLAQYSWQLILTSASPVYVSLCARDPAFQRQFPTGTAFFSNAFYSRFFDVHPPARVLFTDIESQKRFLTKMISLSLSEINEEERIERILEKLAEIHSERGVKAVEYGILGEVLFWSLQTSLGPSIFTADLHLAWIKIYSRMLRIMVPVAVAYELQHGSSAAQENRFNRNAEQIKRSSSMDAMDTEAKDAKG